MSQFTRAYIAPEAVVPSWLEKEKQRIVSDSSFAPYLSIRTEVNGYDASLTLAGMQHALGTRMTRYLLSENSEATMHVGAEVLREHAASGGETSDLQTTLLVNIVKELAMLQEDQYVLQKSRCESILRRCTLTIDYKQHVMGTILKNGNLTNPYIVVVEAPDVK